MNRHGQVGDGLSAWAVAEVVKTCAERAGLEPADFAGHSLRAGFVTSAAERGQRAKTIMGHTGHKSAAMVGIYTRRVDVFENHPGEGLL